MKKSVLKQNWCKVFFGVVIVCFCITAVYFNARQREVRPEQAVIAVNMPISGPISAFFKPYVNGLKMGVADEIQALNLPKDAILLDIADNKGSAVDAVTIFHRQNYHRFDVYISGAVPQSRAIMQLADATGKPHLQVGFLENTTKEGANRIRIFPNFGMEKHVVFDFLNKTKPNKVAFIFHNDEGYLTYFKNSIEPFLKEKKIDYFREIIDLNTQDYRTVIYKLLSQKPDVVVDMSFSVEMLRVVIALKEAGFVAENNTFFNLDFLDLVYDNTDLSITKDVVFTGTHFDVADDNLDFKNRYIDTYGKKPTYVAAYGYDTGQILVKTWQKTGKMTVDTIMDQTPYTGASGHIKMDRQARDLVSSLITAVLNDQGQITEWHGTDK